MHDSSSDKSASRRDAIKAAMMTVGAAMVGTSPIWRSSALMAQASASQPAAPRAFLTDESGHRYESCDDAIISAANRSPDAVFTFDPAQPKQLILGFGAALTEAACTVLSWLNDADRASLMNELYGLHKSNFGIGRLCVGASDYCTKVYSYDEGLADPSLARFSIDRDRAVVLPLLRLARQIRPDLFLFASPWSPPGWMKYGNSMLGGSIRPGNLKVYSDYMVYYLRAYRDAGVVVDALTIQNEIDADQSGQMPACTWAEEVESDYIIKFLGPALALEKNKPQLWLLDHNYNLIGRVLDQLAKPQLRKFVQGIAWHGYAGSPDSMAIAQQRYPRMETHWTEGGDDITSPTLLTAWSQWARQFAEILHNGARSITTWNLALDDAGHPNTGPFRCAGLLTVDSKTKAVTRNGIYWALMHYAKAFPRSSQILTANPAEKKSISAVGASRPDRSLAVVVSNSGGTAVVCLDIADKKVNVKLPANSVATILV